MFQSFEGGRFGRSILDNLELRKMKSKESEKEVIAEDKL